MSYYCMPAISSGTFLLNSSSYRLEIMCCYYFSVFILDVYVLLASWGLGRWCCPCHRGKFSVLTSVWCMYLRFKAKVVACIGHLIVILFLSLPRVEEEGQSTSIKMQSIKTKNVHMVPGLIIGSALILKVKKRFVSMIITWFGAAHRVRSHLAI